MNVDDAYKPNHLYLLFIEDLFISKYNCMSPMSQGQECSTNLHLALVSDVFQAGILNVFLIKNVYSELHNSGRVDN